MGNRTKLPEGTMRFHWSSHNFGTFENALKYIKKVGAKGNIRVYIERVRAGKWTREGYRDVDLPTPEEF